MTASSKPLLPDTEPWYPVRSEHTTEDHISESFGASKSCIQQLTDQTTLSFISLS